MKKVFVFCLALIVGTLLAADPVAFLSDIQGTLFITRDGKKGKLETSCEPVYAGDLIQPDAKASAKIVYADAIFEINGGENYRVEVLNVKKLSGDNAETLKPLTSGIRGGEDDDETSAAIIVPKELVATIVPGITRAMDALRVYAPQNQVYSTEPSVCIGGDSDVIYDITILKNDKPIGKKVRAYAMTLIPFENFETGKVEEDESYAILVQLNGKNMNNPNDSIFYLMDCDEREAVTKKLTSLSTFADSKAQTFFKANVLQKADCSSEAFCLAQQLVLLEPANALYMNLFKMAKKNLGN